VYSIPCDCGICYTDTAHLVLQALHWSL
jgi:hypothetical protein